jgi:hypothetical protein
MTEKPKFPKPRLIREDFLPYKPMKTIALKRKLIQIKMSPSIILW